MNGWKNTSVSWLVWGQMNESMYHILFNKPFLARCIDVPSLQFLTKMDLENTFEKPKYEWLEKHFCFLARWRITHTHTHTKINSRQRTKQIHKWINVYEFNCHFQLVRIGSSIVFWGKVLHTFQQTILYDRETIAY